MSRRDASTFLTAAALLLAASILRHWTLPDPAPPLLPADSAGVREVLAEESRQAREEEARRSRPLAAGERLDPNRAPEIELDRLPGVGPSLARAIVEEREAGGPFRNLGDLVRVRGIGAVTAGRLAPHVKLPDPSSGAAPVVVGRASGSGPPPGRPLTAPAPSRASPDGEEMEGELAAEDPVDLNRADADELQRLPGIGPALARRILAERRARGGRFGSAAELLRVRGIGPATLERIRKRGVVPP